MATHDAHSRASTFASSSSTVKAPPVIDQDIEMGCKAMTSEARSHMAWQYHGYPALSRWMASSNDFFVLRRFSPVQVRCLLYLQNEIAVLDQRLHEWDVFAECQEPEKGNSGWIAEDPEALPNNPRPQIIVKLIPLLKEYNDLVLSFSSLKAKQTASGDQTRNVDNWFKSYGEDAIDLEEQHHKGNQGDLITMLSKPKYPLVKLLDMILHRSRFIRRFTRLRDKMRSDRIVSQSTTYTSTSGVETFAAIVSLIVGLSMTFASIWWLNYVDSKVARLAIITGSGTIMTLIAWAAAGNRPFEILATFAAYMAVLMIYQQISP